MRVLKTNCLIILLLTSRLLFAQDSHYWTSQYGPGGYFIPGAVVANNGDSGVLFYNPALLVYSKLNLLSASATIYNIDRIRIREGAGPGFDLKSSTGGSVPLQAAGNFKLPFTKDFIIAYGIIQPGSFNFATSQRRDERFNVLNDSYSPGPEFFVGQLLRENNSGELHAMASAGFRLFGNVTAGITLEGIRKRQTSNLEYYGRALVNPAGGSHIDLVGNDVSYYATYTNYSLMSRIGLAWEKGPDHVGITVSFPSIRIGGTGTLLVDNVVNNLDFSNTGHFFSLLGNTRQENLRSTWKSPLSIAAGYTHDFLRWQLYGAAEYFAKIDPYNILRPRNEFFLRPDTGNSNIITPDLLQFTDARRAVFNMALGASYKLSEKCRLYGSLRTDRTWWYKRSNNEGFVSNSSFWDIYHLQAGVNLRRSKFNLRTGLYASFGRTDKYPQDVNLGNPNEENFLLGETGNANARYFSLGLMVSYIHNF